MLAILLCKVCLNVCSSISLVRPPGPRRKPAWFSMGAWSMISLPARLPSLAKRVPKGVWGIIANVTGPGRWTAARPLCRLSPRSSIITTRAGCGSSSVAKSAATIGEAPKQAKAANPSSNRRWRIFEIRLIAVVAEGLRLFLKRLRYW